MERLIELSLYVEDKLKTARRVVTDSRAIASGRQFLFHAPHVSTTTSAHITAPCGCTVSTSHRGAAVSRTSLHRTSGADPLTLLPGGTSRFSLRPFDPTSLLDRHDVVGSRFAKTLEIELLDELGQWQFPRLLLVVVDLAQFRWVQPKLSRHLYLAVRQMAASSRIYPFLHLLIGFDFLRHTLSYSSGKNSS
jgi:hypothetical protein